MNIIFLSEHLNVCYAIIKDYPDSCTYKAERHLYSPYRKMTEQYLQELEKLRYRDPAKYAEIVAKLKNG